MRTGRTTCLLSVAFCAALVGCGGESDRWTEARPRVFPVRGRVLFDGQPLAGAKVNFTQPDAGRTAYGQTDAAGRFTLTTFEPGDGAVAGAHQVKVLKYEVISHAKPDFDYGASLESPPPPETRWLIPAAYGDYATSGFSATVQADPPNEVQFELTSAGPAQ